MKKFYVYKWFNKETGQVFYIGKGCNNRYRDIANRNKDFLEYYNTHPCESEIIEFFDSEEEAFKKEYELIQKYKANGQAFTNLDNGGKGGCHFVWTEEMRDYMSKNNPMKDSKQKERFSKENPMKNAEVAAKVGLAHSKAVIIDGEEFVSLTSAAKKYNVTDVTISNWCKKGINPQGKVCKYKNESQKQKNGYNKKQQKSVVIDDIHYFSTIKEAAAFLNTPSSHLGKILRQGKTTCKNHSCKYANQQPSQENTNNSILEGSTTNE